MTVSMVATDDLSSLLGSGARTKGHITTKLHKNNKVSVTVVHMLTMFYTFQELVFFLTLLLALAKFRTFVDTLPWFMGNSKGLMA